MVSVEFGGDVTEHWAGMRVLGIVFSRLGGSASYSPRNPGLFSSLWASASSICAMRVFQLSGLSSPRQQGAGGPSEAQGEGALWSPDETGWGMAGQEGPP